ncbi:MAG TPA: RagB/SusD family nutrient uptake outer membrane protein [Prolixibacteraceae bacterium]|nr:RagB/SusD family nutrient uptake outer membrane protein [Prolixibacteraceae bacterium]
MMKNNLKRIVILFAVVLSLGACTESFYDETPSDRILPDEHYNSMKEAEISCKAPLAILRNVVPQMVFANELLSDLTTVTENAGLYWQDINNHNLSQDNPHINPAVFYQVVINANESLLYIDSIANKDQDITEIDIKIFKGNLIGIRSWAYFTLARLYGEVAFLKDNLPQLSADQLVYLPRLAIMDTLINDLLPYLDIDYEDIGNITMYNKALIGEIYLEKQDYENAITYLRMAIEGFENLKTKYKLTKDFSKASWQNLFINANSNTSEIMITVPFSFVNNQSNPIELWYGYHFDYLAKPTPIIMNLFNQQADMKGNPGDVYRGITVSYDTINGVPFVNKYNLDPGLPLSSDIILYRSADIHLLLAEAMNRAGYSDIALALLNEGYHEFTNWGSGLGVRGRAYLAPKTIPDGVNLVNYVEDLIMEERALELAFEGKRWTDLMRVARRRGNSWLADRVAAKFSNPDQANKIKEKLNNEQNWYLPFSK